MLCVIVSIMIHLCMYRTIRGAHIILADIIFLVKHIRESCNSNACYLCTRHFVMWHMLKARQWERLRKACKRTSTPTSPWMMCHFCSRNLGNEETIMWWKYGKRHGGMTLEAYWTKSHQVVTSFWRKFFFLKEGLLSYPIVVLGGYSILKETITVESWKGHFLLHEYW